LWRLRKRWLSVLKPCEWGQRIKPLQATCFTLQITVNNSHNPHATSTSSYKFNSKLKPQSTLILPGWLNSGPLHWQTLWERAYGYERVEQHDWQRPLRGDWIARLEDVVLAQNAGQPISLVAHSLGCHLVAAWAAVSRNAHRVKAALLVAPPDMSRADFPADMHSWRKPLFGPMPGREAAPTRFPFTATCVLSSNDPFGSLERGQQQAAAWGANSVEIGPRGHINGESGLGDWPQGHELLRAVQQKSQAHWLANTLAATSAT
jgi:uncharacterized protein